MSVLIFIDRSSLTALNEAFVRWLGLAGFDALQASCRRPLPSDSHRYESYTIIGHAGPVKSYVIIFHEFLKKTNPQPGVRCLASAGLPKAVPSLRQLVRSG
jgi:hypothetical protein